MKKTKGKYSHGLNDATLCASHIRGCVELMIDHSSRAEPDLFINGLEIEGTTIKLFVSKDSWDGFASITFTDLDNAMCTMLDNSHHYSMRNKDQQYILFVPYATDDQMSIVGTVIAEGRIEDSGI